MDKNEEYGELSKLDRQLLNIIQKDLPLVSRPFQKIADKIGISEQEVIERLQKLRKENYIRRVGGIFSPQKLGYVSTLLAAEVKTDEFYHTAEKINKYRGVTHNYRRNHRFNLWFTLIAKNKEKLQDQISEIKSFDEIQVLREFPVTKRYKLQVDLDMNKNEG